ncbi:PTS transporter subunit EIIC [Enterobacter hormaechei]|uniref:PTS transporter subunit EIIC n=1 Tax=Enterobacter ludwigii TaxID=299767 RepID=A0AAX3LI93_9ENTR|nr:MULTISPECIES: PTS transporter subunit EIIC [Enterobacter cloacae complex]MCW4755630.1 PTS transporter subunit EIIC [Enterobacter hormaechei]WCE15980.1 PTS transporter subunit EIIC [Enterobacter ludwigii]
MITKYEVQSIIEELGGKENIQDYFHCATRLRFNLFEPNKANIEALKKISSILAVIQASGQCQLIIGNNVSSYYQKVVEVLGSSPPPANQNEEVSPPTQERLINRLFAFISGSFLPLIGLLAAAGLLRAGVILLGKVDALNGSDTLKILSFLAEAPFYFLPVLLGVTIAKKLKSNELTGAVTGAVILYPGFTPMVGEKLSFLSLPLWILNYGGGVFPMFLAIPLAWKIETVLKKRIPESIQLFSVPFLTLLIVVPATLLLLGPFGTIVGDYLATGILFIISLNGIISGMVIGAVYSFIVLFGLQWSLMPIILSNIAQGGDPIYALGGMSAIAQMGVALGILLKTRDAKTKELAASAFFPALISGVTEPILYGLIIPNRKAVLYIILAGAVGGAINGYYHITINSPVFSSLLAIPTASSYIVYASALFSTLFTGAVLVLLFGYKSRP